MNKTYVSFFHVDDKQHPIFSHDNMPIVPNIGEVVYHQNEKGEATAYEVMERNIFLFSDKDGHKDVLIRFYVRRAGFVD